MAPARSRRKPFELAPGYDTGKFRTREPDRRAARLRFARHAGHAAAVREDGLGFHAGRLDARRRRTLDAARRLRAGDPARARAPRHRSRRRCGASPSASRTSRAEQVRDEVAAGRMIIPANKVHLGLQPRSDGIGRAEPHQDQRQHGRLAGLERHRRGSREAALGRALGRRHGDGPLHRRRPRRTAARRSCATRTVPIGTVPIYSMIIGRKIEDLDDDVDPRGARAPGARRASTTSRSTPACCREHLPFVAQPADRHRQPRRLAARQVDARTTASRTRCTTHLGRHLRHHARVRRDVLDRRRPAPRRPRRRDRRGAARASSTTLGELTERAWRKGVQVMIEGPGPRAVRSDRIQHEARSAGSATARRSTCSARS